MNRITAMITPSCVGQASSQLGPTTRRSPAVTATSDTVA
jgi:hypothetical protein